ncbi:hypothetical protein HHI36_000675 [Cryptolaemus montrouzieri]|uniref:Uncharacterized protein n=1 Tax=Cryptolaemus montrouzieri TaxID=559131 RepID=A0ABD2P656_9CUCU
MPRYYSERLGLRVSRSYEEEQKYLQSLMDENSDIDEVTNNSDSDDDYVPHNIEANEYFDIDDFEERDLRRLLIQIRNIQANEVKRKLKLLQWQLIAIWHWLGCLEGKKS